MSDKYRQGYQDGYKRTYRRTDDPRYRQGYTDGTCDQLLGNPPTTT